MSTSRSRLRVAALCAVLAAAGLGLDLLPLEILPGVHLVFGGLFALLAAVWFGPVAGGLVGFAAALPTWSLWHQPLPLSALLYGLEGVWVGVALRAQHRRGLLPAVLAYWLLLGSWLNLVVQLTISGLALPVALIIQCRSIVNGLLVAILAELVLRTGQLIAHHRAGRRSDRLRAPDFESLVSLALVAMVSLPILWIAVRSARSLVEQRLAEQAERVSRNVGSIEAQVTTLMESYARGVSTAAALARQSGLADAPRLQGLLATIRAQYPEFAGMYVADREARTLAFDPAVDEEGRSLIGSSFADRDYYHRLVASRSLVYSGVYQARGGMTGPAVAIGAPVAGPDGELAGFVLGWFDVNDSFRRIVSQDAGAGSEAVITDSQGLLVADSMMPAGGYRRVIDVSGRSAFERARTGRQGVLYEAPDGPTAGSPALSTLGRSRLLAAATLPGFGWKVWVDQSLQPVQAALVRSSLSQLLVLIGVLLLALLLSRGLARLVGRPLERLRQSAERLAQGDLAERPDPVQMPIAEIESLYRSFDRMADNLEAGWSRQRQLLEEVSITKRELEATFDAMHDGVVITDREDRLLRANRAFYDFLSLDPEHAEGRSLAGLIHPEGGAEDCPACRARKAGLAKTILLAGTRSETARPLEVRLDVIRDAEGEVVGSVEVVRGLSGTRRDETLRALGQLASGIAHNFNNSLTAVLGYTQLARRQTDDPRLAGSLETVEMAALDAAKMVRRIQRFAQPGGGQGPMETAPLGPLVQDALDLTRSRWEADAHARGIEYAVRFDAAAAGGLAIDCDPSALREVFVNLVINALDAMPSGGELAVTAEDGDGEVRIVFADTGCGMSAEVQGRIFEPFFTTKGTLGQGMGLAVSYAMIQHQGGRLEVESAPGLGSRFTVTLAKSARGSGSELAAGGAAAAGDYGEQRRPAVLVVEDEAVIRKMLRRALEGRGFRVETANDGAAALEVLARQAFDLVLSDLAMPGADGLVVARAVRRRSPATKMVLMTGYGELYRQVRDDWDAGEAPVDALVSKPFAWSELFTLLESLLPAARPELPERRPGMAT